MWSVNIQDHRCEPHFSLNPYGDTWKLISSSKFDTGRFPVKETVLLYGKNKLLTWQWYRMGEFQTSSPYRAKLYEVYSRIFSGRSDGAYIVLSTPLAEDKATARQALSEFFHYSVDVLNAEFDALQQQAVDSE